MHSLKICIYNVFAHHVKSSRAATNEGAKGAVLHKLEFKKIAKNLFFLSD
jgi:hypothetical protein